MMSGAGPCPAGSHSAASTANRRSSDREPELEALIARMVEAVHLQVVGGWRDGAVEFRREQRQQAAALVAAR